MKTRPESPVPPLAGKRVLYGITKSNGGGAQTHVLMMAKGAKAAGAEVKVMAGGADGKGGAVGFLFEELGSANIPTIPLTAIRRDVKGLGEWHAFKELLEIIRAEKPDVLHLNSSKMGVLGGLAGRVAGVKHIIFTAHGWPNKEPRGILWKLMAWAGSWLTIMLAHKVICVSETDLRNSPTLLFRDELVLVHNGMSDFPRLQREEARAKLAALAPDLAKYSYWLLMNAELHQNKGAATAIRALAELKGRHPEMALVLCGEGQARKGLTELALALGVSSQVFFLGFVPNARQYLEAADIYLLPSRKEGLPLCLLEAGLASLPVIASKVGGIPEVIIHKENGLFIPRNNTHLLAMSISYLFNNSGEARALGASLRETVLKDFSETQMVRETLAAYT